MRADLKRRGEISAFDDPSPSGRVSSPLPSRSARIPTTPPRPGDHRQSGATGRSLLLMRVAGFVEGRGCALACLQAGATSP